MDHLSDRIRKTADWQIGRIKSEIIGMADEVLELEQDLSEAEKENTRLIQEKQVLLSELDAILVARRTHT